MMDVSTRAEKGAATRAKILKVARQRFAADGYDRATIRTIAAEACIDPSLVMRYFGSKQGLFVAAADIDLRMPELGDLPREQVGAALVQHFLSRWEADDIMQALLRTAATNEQAAERMRSMLASQTVPTVSAASGDPGMALLRADLISSQFLGFAYCRFVLKLPSLTGLSHAQIVEILEPPVSRFLFDQLPD